MSFYFVFKNTLKISNDIYFFIITKAVLEKQKIFQISSRGEKNP